MTLKTLEIDTSQSKVSFHIKKLGFLTIDTENAKRDEHLKSNDFFYVKEFSKIKFQSTKIRKEKDQFLAIGQLTILNKTNEVSIPFSYENKTLKGNFSLNRLDYDLGKKFPPFIVGKTVQILINTKIK